MCCQEGRKQDDADLARIRERMASVKHKVIEAGGRCFHLSLTQNALSQILVMSGKGGVGKSTVACQLSHAFAALDYQVGVLDIDVCGPSCPRMLGVSGEEVHMSGLGWTPVYVDDNLGVLSVSFLLSSAKDALIWRGARKSGIVKQFLRDVHWGDELDVLIVDCPPGTSDEHLAITSLLSGCDGISSVVVTTPAEVALLDVRKEVHLSLLLV